MCTLHPCCVVLLLPFLLAPILAHKAHLVMEGVHQVCAHMPAQERVPDDRAVVTQGGARQCKLSTSGMHNNLTQTHTLQ